MTSFEKGRARNRAFPAVATVSLFACLFLGCSQEPPASSPESSTSASPPPAAGTSAEGVRGNRPPIVMSARVLADALTRNDTVSSEFAVGDPDGDRVTVRYQWLANGSPVEGQTSATLALSSLKRGDRVSLEIVPTDARGFNGPTYRTDAVVVGNTPPAGKRVTIEPAVAKPGDTLRAVIEGSDQDGDPIRYLIEWWVNGQSTGTPSNEQEQRTLATESLKRGDMVVVGVTPYDASSRGRFLVSEPLFLLNRPPVITSSPTAPTARAYEYAVTAADPDNDPLTFKLDTAPSDMTIERSTGKIAWQVPSNLRGPQQVRVSVDDGNEGQAFQEFTITPPPSR